MEKRIIKRICVLAKLGKSGLQKEVNVIKEGDNYYYHLGIWSNHHQKCLDGFSLSEQELKLFLKEAERQKLRDTEMDKFIKDYEQQSHNGYVQSVEKEKVL